MGNKQQKIGKAAFSEGVFSIGVVCYRNWEYMVETIDSILNQDYERIQLVVSDDGSDGFPEDYFRHYILENRKDNLVDFTVRHSEKNEGTVKHLNHVVDAVNGEYVMFMAADDALDNPHVFTQYAEAFRKEGDNCMAIMAQTAIYDEKLKTLKGYYVYPKVIEAINNTGKNNELIKELFFLPCIPTTSIVLRHKTLDQYGPFDTEYSLMEDYPFHIKLAQEQVIMRFGNFVGARHRDGGISHGAVNALSKSKEMYINDCIRARTKSLDIMDQYQVSDWIKIFNKQEIESLEFTRTTLGKGLKGKLNWLKKNPSDFLSRLARKLPLPKKKMMITLMILLLLSIFIPQKLLQQMVSIMPGLSSETWALIARIIMLLFSASALIVTGWLYRFKKFDDYPWQITTI